MNDALMLVAIGAMFGAPCGAVLLPTASWLSLRHVSFGRTLGFTIAGATLGALAGWFLPVGSSELLGSFSGATLGFILGVVAARRSWRPSS
jgi:uncharacterized membrane protein YccC